MREDIIKRISTMGSTAIIGQFILTKVEYHQEAEKVKIFSINTGEIIFELSKLKNEKLIYQHNTSTEYGIVLGTTSTIKIEELDTLRRVIRSTHLYGVGWDGKKTWYMGEGVVEYGVYLESIKVYLGLPSVQGDALEYLSVKYGSAERASICRTLIGPGNHSITEQMYGLRTEKYAKFTFSAFKNSIYVIREIERHHEVGREVTVFLVAFKQSDRYIIFNKPELVKDRSEAETAMEQVGMHIFDWFTEVDFR